MHHFQPPTQATCQSDRCSEGASVCLYFSITGLNFKTVKETGLVSLCIVRGNRTSGAKQLHKSLTDEQLERSKFSVSVCSRGLALLRNVSVLFERFYF